MDPRAAFLAALPQLGISDPQGVTLRFDSYLQLLEEYNQRVNLVSRATAMRDYWTKHFLDSLMLLKCIDLTGAKVLDFGSGGGFPGLPIKLAGVDCDMTLLDSTGKKVAALRDMLGALQVPSCVAVCSRIEDHQPSPGALYKVILCRAVRMEARYRQPLLRLLASGGKVIFYKSAAHEDLDDYAPETLLEEDTQWGRRLILSIAKERLKISKSIG